MSLNVASNSLTMNGILEGGTVNLDDLTISGTLTVDGIVNITNTTASTTTSTGALIVAGGVGIAGNLNTGGRVVIKEATGTDASPNDASLVIRHNNTGGTSSISFPSTNNNGSDYAYIKFQDDYLNSTTSERARLIIGIENDPSNPNNTDAIILQSASGVGRVGINNLTPLYTLDICGNLNVASTARVSGITNILNITASTTTANGALIVSGGMGIAGNISIGGVINVLNPSTNTFYGFSNNTVGGTNNTSFGNNVLSVATGVKNTGIGSGSLKLNTTGVENTIIG